MLEALSLNSSFCNVPDPGHRDYFGLQMSLDNLDAIALNMAYNALDMLGTLQYTRNNLLLPDLEYRSAG